MCCVGTATVENSMEIHQKLKIELPHDGAILLLGIYLEEIKTGFQQDICMSMFIVALFTITMIWKQPKCPSMDE